MAIIRVSKALTVTASVTIVPEWTSLWTPAAFTS